MSRIRYGRFGQLVGQMVGQVLAAGVLAWSALGLAAVALETLLENCGLWLNFGNNSLAAARQVPQGDVGGMDLGSLLGGLLKR